MKQRVQAAVCLLLLTLIVTGCCGCLLPDSGADFSGDASSLSVGSPYKHYFERLSEKERHAYNAALSAVSDFPERIEIPVLTSQELQETYTSLLYDNPELFFLSGEFQMRQVKNRAFLYPGYRMSAEDYEPMRRKCDSIASQIITDARKETSAFDRERVVHDRLIAMCSYSDDNANPYKNTIYGVLCGQAAACEGYAKTAKYLLDRLDITCCVVVGKSTPPGSRTQSHMWNVVELDGEWYHLDLTWDDPILEKGGSLIRYTYFNVTDEKLQKTHSDYDAGCTCDATKENFFVHENLLFKQFGDAEKERAAAFAAQTISAGSDGFQLCFAFRKAYEDAQRKLFTEEQIYSLLQQIRKQTDRKFATDRVSYYTSDEYLNIEIVLEQSKEGGEDNGYAEN